MTRKILLAFGLLWSIVASAQFIPGQVLTAAELNSQFALYAPLTGAVFTGSVGGTTASFSGLVSVASLTATGTISLPTASLPLPYLAAQLANTLVANADGSAASPTAISAPSCSTSSSALQWTSGAGLACNTAINASTLGGVAAASYLTAASAASTYATIAQATTALAATGGTANNVILGGITPAAAAFTTVVMSSTFKPQSVSGVVGTTVADNAQAGSIGEFVTATGTNVPLTSNTPANVTSISLTAGDWDVTGNIYFTPATGTTIANEVSGISTTSVTFPAIPLYAFSSLAVSANQEISLIPPQTRINVASTTTVYLIAQSSFTVSTLTATGVISARRRR